MKNILKVILFIFLGIVVIGIIGSFFDSSSKSKSDKTVKNKDVVSDSTNTVDKTKETTKWTYSDEKDKMSDGKVHIAQIDANENLEFKFPYDGGSTPTLILRNKEGKREVIFTISKGQFLPNTMDDQTIRVRFDNDKSERYSYSDAADGSTETIFISNSKKFLSRIKKSKKTVIECQFYDEGSRTMEFVSAGLNFPY
jgi:hypothetical protein